MNHRRPRRTAPAKPAARLIEVGERDSEMLKFAAAVTGQTPGQVLKQLVMQATAVNRGKP